MKRQPAYHVNYIVYSALLSVADTLHNSGNVEWILSLSSIILLHFKFNFISISTLHLALFELRCCFCCRQFSIFIFNLRNCKLTIAFLKFNFQFLRCGFCLTHDCWCVCFYSYCFYCYCCCCAALLFWLANHQRIVMSKATIVNLSKAKQQYRKKQKKTKAKQSK